MPSGSLPILTYHAIETDGSVTSTDPSWFVHTIDTLVDSGYQAVDLGEWVARGRPALENAFAITFDDGLRSILKVAEMLASRHLPALVFLLGRRIGRDNAWPGQRPGIPVQPLLDRREIETLAGQGFRFGSHGLDHARLNRLETTTLEHELTASQDMIEQITGQPCRFLAYPYGESSPRIKLAAWKVYDAAFGTRLAYTSRLDNILNLPRIDAYYLRDRRSLELMIANRWQGRLAIRRALRTARRWVEI